VFHGKSGTAKKVEINIIEMDILKEGNITDLWVVKIFYKN